MGHLVNGGARAVFFDLDGTLVDTAPDMVRALQDLQREHGLEPVSYPFGRSHVSNGALGLLKIAFPDREIQQDSALMCDFLDRYAGDVCTRSTIFEGLDALLDQLDAAPRPWGVVTNKPTRLTVPIMEHLRLASRSACTVCGDTLPTRKPDPAQLLLACERIGLPANDCIYVGDAARDVEAGARAGMTTIAVGYGYVVDDDDPYGWGADAYADNPHELAQMVLKAVNLDAP